MAAPNIVNVTSIYGKSALAALTTTTANVVTNSAASGNVAKIDSVTLTNYSAGALTANVVINRSSTTYYLAGLIAIPAASTLTLIGKDSMFYLEEGDVLQANCSANASISMTVGYELIT